jgi:Ca2+-binding EF-hand superfamily protein
MQVSGTASDFGVVRAIDRQSKPEAKMKFTIAPSLLLLGCAISFCAVLPGAPLSAAPARNASQAALQQLDSDHDGTVDLSEAKAAGAALFDRLDHDHDGTLDRREVRGRVTAAQFAAADSDHDGTLSRDEYVAVLEMRFNAADTDHDGTLDAKELRSPAGRNLLRILM